METTGMGTLSLGEATEKPETVENIILDFEAFPPLDEDIPGVVLLLKQLFGGNEPLNFHELAEILIRQNYIGCVLKQADVLDGGGDDDDQMDDDTVYAFTTVVNLTAKKDVSSISQVTSYLKEKAKGTSGEARFNEILAGSMVGGKPTEIGLIIHERFVNLPSDVSVPMLESMLTDLEGCKKKRMPYNFSHYIFISKMYKLVDPPQTLHYVYPEDELWSELKENDVYAAFDYQMSSEMDTILVEGGKKNKPITATLWRRVRVITPAALLKLIEIFKTTK